MPLPTNTPRGVRDLADRDVDAVLRINAESVDVLSPLTAAGLDAIRRESTFCKVVTWRGAVVAFILTLPPGASYASVNYRWFAARYADFLYVDRVVVDLAHQRRGHGQALYAHLLASVASRAIGAVACEFDLFPPNAASLAFHERYGFAEVGRQQLPGSTKSVSLRLLRTPAPASRPVVHFLPDFSSTSPAMPFDDSVYRKLRQAALSPEQFLAHVNSAELRLDDLVDRCDAARRPGPLPPELLVGQAPQLRVRLLAGAAFERARGGSGRHIVYPLLHDIVATDAHGHSERIGPYEPIDIGEDIVRLEAMDRAGAVLLDLSFGAAAGFTVAASASAAAGHAGELDNNYYWDFEERYLQAYREGGDSWESLAPNRALEAFVAEHGDRIGDVIDLGTGEGRDAIYLAEQGMRVTGVDVAAAGLAKARALARARGVDPVFLQRDVVHLRGFADNSFDAALNMGCLHLIDVPAQRARHLQRVLSILRPGGLFLLGHCRSDWLKGFWSVDDFESVKERGTGAMIPTRIRKAGGGSFVTEMPILRHVAKDDAALAAELRAAGFEAAGEYDVRTLADLGNVCVLAARKPLAPAPAAATQTGDA